MDAISNRFYLRWIETLVERGIFQSALKIVKLKL